MNPTISTLSDTLAIPPTLPDVSRQPETKMVTYKPEVRHISGLDWDIREIPVATPKFSTTPDSIVIMPTPADNRKSTWRPVNWKCDVSHHSDIREIFLYCTFAHEILQLNEFLHRNGGSTIKIYNSNFFCCFMLFGFQIQTVCGLRLAILISGCWPTSSGVGNITCESDVVKNVEVATGTPLISKSSPQIIVYFRF